MVQQVGWWNGTDRVRSWSQTVERVVPVLICHELAAEVQVALVGVLLFVQACESLRKRPAGSRGASLPFVDACQMSTVAPAIGLPLTTSVTRPYMNATSASLGVSKLIVVPFGRTG